MNVVLFASDIKYYNYLVNIHKELVAKNHNSFFLYTESSTTSINLSDYSYDYKEEVDLTNGFVSKSLFGISLPFKPDLLILARERWQPEQNIIKEFKEVFNTKIALLELNTELLQVYENILEYYSRNQYPQNMCDIYFEHSKCSLQKRVDAGFTNSDKSVIVGNPKYDNLMSYKPVEESTSSFNEKYSLVPYRENVLYYSNQGLGRNRGLDGFRRLVEKYNDKYNFLYKPFPGEPYNPRYVNQINDSKFFIPGVKVIYDDSDLSSLVFMCDIHIGTVSSITYFPLILDKKVVNINNICNYEKPGTEMNTLFEKNEDVASGETGIAADFWTKVFNLESTDKLIELIGIDRLEKFKKDNKEVRDIISRNTIDWDDDFKFLETDKPDNKELRVLFDDFNDFSASKRIVKYMEDSV